MASNRCIVVDRGKVMEIKVGSSKIRRQTSGQGNTTFRVRIEDHKPETKRTIREAAEIFCHGVPSMIMDGVHPDQLVSLFSLSSPSVRSVREVMPGYYVTFPYKYRHRRRSTR